MKITLYPKYLFRSLFVKGKSDFYSAGYKCLYPKYSEHGMTPWQHYVIDGQRKGYDNGNHPSGDSFFPEGYECEYPDVKLSGGDAWHHYAEKGLPDGRDNGLHPKDDQFFPEGYLEMYPDVAESGMDPWHHYVLIGKPEGRDCGLHPADNTFFPEGYLEMYPAVAESGMDPWHHYVLKGKKEGRDCGLHPKADIFFPEGYMEMYPDVTERGMDPWRHYVLAGKQEGRDNGMHPVADLFFPEGYLEMYPDVADCGTDPWHHYIEIGKKGWRDNGLHPNSEQFFADGYLETYPDVAECGMDPWHHYVLIGKQEGRDNGLYLHSSEASDERIAEYWKNHTKCRKVIYTCLTGEYDRLVNYHCLSDDYDYICFTDNPALLRLKTYGVWQIKPLSFAELDNSRNSRWHKMHPHELFPQYEESIWIDSNINILTDYIFNVIKNAKVDFIVPKHFYHDCIYDELKLIVQCNKDSAERMRALYDLYTAQHLPHHLGAPETNLLYRKHHDKKIIEMMHMWWDMIVRYSNRDQASFMYVMWKNQFSPVFIPNLRTDPTNFSLSSHREFPNAYSLLKIQNYKKLIDSHKVISFSIFDTLLVSPYLSHSDMFALLERNEHKPGFAEARVQAENSVHHAVKNEAGITLDMIYANIGESYKSLQEKEEELELQTCQPHTAVKELYDYALRQGKMIIATEDSYYSGQFLSKLLKKNGYHKFDLVLSSSEVRGGKRDGQLYKGAISRLECSPQEILHIGSDPVLDGEKPTQVKISSAVIEKASEHLFKINPKVLAFSKIYDEDRLASSIYLGLLSINSIKSQEYASQKEYFENIGYEYGGIAAWQFMTFVYDGCLRNKIKDIAFLSWSGVTLKKVFDLFDCRNLNSNCVRAPEALSSVILPQEGSDCDDLIEALIRHCHDAGSTKDSKHYKSLAGSSSEHVKIEKENISLLAKADYQAYLSQFNYSSPKLAVVDLSDRLPAAQRLFEKMYPEKKITGYCWRRNSGTKGDISAFDRAGESFGILEPWAFMEFLFSAPECRVKDIFHGRPVYGSESSRDEKYRAAVSTYITEGIVKFVQDVKRIFGESDISFSPLMTSLLIQTLCRNPSAEDRKFMRDLCFRNGCDGKYKRLFRLW